MLHSPPTPAPEVFDYAETRPAALLLTLSLVAAPTFAQDRNTDSLRGLKGVEVLVETLRSEAEEAGLTCPQLQTDVELKLRLAGIPVLNRSQSVSTTGAPTLYINVNACALKRLPNLFAYSVRLDLQQDVTLLRDPRIIVPQGTTWHTSSTTVTARTGFVESVRSDTRDGVDEFINAYLTANPKK